MFQPRRYEVTGSQPVAPNGAIHEPGSFFEEDIDPVQEARLLASGALTVVPVEPQEFPPPLDAEPNPTNDSTTEDLNG